MRRGRKEKELSHAGGPASAFAGALREVRRSAGSPTYRQMGTAVHFSAPALSQAASGARLPSWPVTVAYLKACGVTDLAPWENDWHIARIEMRLIRATGASQDPDSLAAPRDQLCEILNRLAQAKGLSLRAIAAQTKRCQAELASAGGPVHTLSSSTIHDVLSGRRPITHDFVTIFLNAVGATTEEQRCVGEAIGRLEFKRSTTAVTPESVASQAASAAPSSPSSSAESVASQAAAKAVGRAKVLELATADTIVAPGVPDTSGPGVRHHRTATGYYRGDDVRLLRNPTTVVGVIVAVGVACWIAALALAGPPSIAWSAYDFGSTVLIASGFTTLVTVMILLSTVLRDDDPPGQGRVADWHRRWRYQARHGLCP